MINYIFCPQCTTKLKQQNTSYRCDTCPLTIYRDPIPTVCAFILNDKNQVLVNKRAIEPRKDTYDIPGGFLNLNEDSGEAIHREVFEETGLKIKIVDLLSIHKDRYGENGNHIINIYYVAKVSGGDLLAKDDVKDLEWVMIDEIPQMGFESANNAVRDFKKWINKSPQRI